MMLSLGYIWLINLMMIGSLKLADSTSSSSSVKTRNRGGLRVNNKVRNPQLSFQDKRSQTHPKLCDNVKQVSGFISLYYTDREVFFWYFESRHQPETDPLLFYMTGLMGSSSLLGRSMGSWPCQINQYGNDTLINPYAWNSHANILFIDENPQQYGFIKNHTNTEYSFTSIHGYSFLNNFMKRINRNFSNIFIASEGYGGFKALDLAHFILKMNQQQPDKQINIKSVILGSSLLDAHTQFASLPAQVCNTDYQLNTCSTMYENIPHCQSAIKDCQNSHPDSLGEKENCQHAFATCIHGLFVPYTGLNRSEFDVRLNPPPHHYINSSQAEQRTEMYLNQPSILKQLGIPVNYTFKSKSDAAFQNQFLNSKSLHSRADKLTELLDNNIDLLLYAGEYDYICNWDGLETFTRNLLWDQATIPPLTQVSHSLLIAAYTGETLGLLRSHHGLTIAQIFDAGHQVQMDQPAAVQELIVRYLHQTLSLP